MPHLLPDRQCALDNCEATSGPSRCVDCQVVYCCGRPHQAADHPAHKFVCIAAKKAKAKLERQETKICNLPPPDFFFPGNVFEDHVGRF
jgi:hypothetical protein